MKGPETEQKQIYAGVQNTNYSETTSVKMIVLAHPQGFTDTQTKNDTNYCISQPMSTYFNR